MNVTFYFQSPSSKAISVFWLETSVSLLWLHLHTPSLALGHPGGSRRNSWTCLK